MRARIIAARSTSAARPFEGEVSAGLAEETSFDVGGADGALKVLAGSASFDEAQTRLGPLGPPCDAGVGGMVLGGVVGLAVDQDGRHHREHRCHAHVEVVVPTAATEPRLLMTSPASSDRGQRRRWATGWTGATSAGGRPRRCPAGRGSGAPSRRGWRGARRRPRSPAGHQRGRGCVDGLPAHERPEKDPRRVTAGRWPVPGPPGPRGRPSPARSVR